MWKAKIVAATKHALITVVVACITASLVFFVWYPGVFSQLMPGSKLFILILCVEVVLGPCMSLVIFNPTKTVRHLVIDYSIVGLVQLAALTYGVYSVIETRPVYVVFVKDRYEVVSAAALSVVDQQEAADPKFKHFSWSGPEFVCTRKAADAIERERILFVEVVNGKDYQHLPKFYQDCTNNFAYERARNMDELYSIAARRNMTLQLEKLIAGHKDLRWAPIIGKTGAWVALVNQNSSQPIGYLPLDPY